MCPRKLHLYLHVRNLAYYDTLGDLWPQLVELRMENTCMSLKLEITKHQQWMTNLSNEINSKLEDVMSQVKDGMDAIQCDIQSLKR